MLSYLNFYYFQDIYYFYYDLKFLKTYHITLINVDVKDYYVNVIFEVVYNVYIKLFQNCGVLCTTVRKIMY